MWRIGPCNAVFVDWIFAFTNVYSVCIWSMPWKRKWCGGKRYFHFKKSARWFVVGRLLVTMETVFWAGNQNSLAIKWVLAAILNLRPKNDRWRVSSWQFPHMCTQFKSKPATADEVIRIGHIRRINCGYETEFFNLEMIVLFDSFLSCSTFWIDKINHSISFNVFSCHKDPFFRKLFPNF